MSAELRLRLLSAAVGLPLIALVVWAGGFLLAAVAALIAALAAIEAHTLLRRAGWRTCLRWGMLWAGLMAAAATQGAGTVLLVLAVGAVAFAVYRAAGWSRARPSRSLSDAARNWAAMTGGTAYVGLPFAALALLRQADNGLDWLAVAFLATFATDTSAYVVGSLFGRRRLAPSVSPGKTWEGAIGGLLGGFAATLALLHLLNLAAGGLIAAAALGVAIPIAGQAGDLFESWLKRKAGAKDSGSLIPGHGGLLDRLDSLAPVVTLVYVAARY